MKFILIRNEFNEGDIHLSVSSPLEYNELASMYWTAYATRLLASVVKPEDVTREFISKFIDDVDKDNKVYGPYGSDAIFGIPEIIAIYRDGTVEKLFFDSSKKSCTEFYKQFKEDGIDTIIQVINSLIELIKRNKRK